MQTTIETIDVLNDLILINSHWISGYENALKELKSAEEELKVLQRNLIEQNSDFLLAEPREVKVFESSMEWGAANNGTIFKAWTDIKAIFKGQDRQTVLNAARKAHTTAMASENLPAVLRELIEKQKAILKTSQEQIKASVQ